ncbi:MAG: CRISPR-associated endonuclease Cas1 [Chloroflexi bacterium]|nr:MAG: CRISPR-associated endonuclease Cas1 [Chloroflexota bacterium]
MAPVYIREQGAVVRRRGERLVVTRNKKQLLELPLLHVDQLILMGNVQLTSPAVAMLLQKEVDVVFLSSYGKFRGRLIHTGSKFARLRHAQLQKMSDLKVSLSIAREVVSGKLHNQLFVLQAQVKQGASPVVVQRSLSGIKRMLDQARRAKNVDSLRGYEGKAGADYWAAFQALLPDTFGFQGRKYYPPPDPVNALLSFGYSLLLKDVTAAVQVVGLDPYLGFFHTIDYGRPSLALDMMEEFRPIIVDLIVLDILQTGQMSTADFEHTRRPDQPVRLKARMMNLLIQRYEQRCGDKAPHRDAGGRTSLRRVIELQVRRLARLMLDQEQQYQPFLMKNGALS